MKILVLGGSYSQINAVYKLKAKGHTVIVSDYYEDAPAKQFSDYSELVSTFDVAGNIEIARKYNIDGVMTLGTDQPVYTAARVAEELNLPSLINADTAKAVTNKKIMKQRFVEYGIPTSRHRILKEDFDDAELECISFPVVIKPLDSQGQRGVYKLDSIKEVRAAFRDVLSYSREKEILLEEYYESDEITLSGWVRDEWVHVLAVTDRVTYSNGPHIGICTAHDFPTKHKDRYCYDIMRITREIVQAFNIRNGPVYFQMLIGEEGIKVNEVACRIGGAYEDELIPLLTGVDILDMVIGAALGENIDFTALKGYDFSRNNKAASVQMIFTRPGRIKYIGDMDEIRQLPGVAYSRYILKPDYEVKEITNATQRAGYMIIQGENRDVLSSNIKRAYNELKIYDERMRNMILRNMNQV